MCQACGDNGQRCCYDSTSTSSTYGPGCKSPNLCTYSSSTGSYYCTPPTTTTTTGG
jgi:hypothetical protein